jgi:hypothetical protein
MFIRRPTICISCSDGNILYQDCVVYCIFSEYCGRLSRTTLILTSVLQGGESDRSLFVTSNRNIPRYDNGLKRICVLCVRVNNEGQRCSRKSSMIYLTVGSMRHNTDRRHIRNLTGNYQ